MKNIEALIDDGGDITVGRIAGIDCAATAADGHNALAMLVCVFQPIVDGISG